MMMEIILRVMCSGLFVVFVDVVKLLCVVLEKVLVIYKMIVVVLDELYICVGFDILYLFLMVFLLCFVNILM